VKEMKKGLRAATPEEARACSTIHDAVFDALRESTAKTNASAAVVMSAALQVVASLADAMNVRNEDIAATVKGMRERNAAKAQKISTVWN
jgi:succinyl-CoA synthetase alpha subunit